MNPVTTVYRNDLRRVMTTNITYKTLGLGTSVRMDNTTDSKLARLNGNKAGIVPRYSFDLPPVKQNSNTSHLNLNMVRAEK